VGGGRHGLAVSWPCCLECSEASSGQPVRPEALAGRRRMPSDRPPGPPDLKVSTAGKYSNDRSV